MGYWFGFVVGASGLVYILSNLIEWALFKRILNDPKVGIFASTACATMILFFLYLRGSAQAGVPAEGALAMIGAGVLIGVARLLSRRSREAAHIPEPGPEDVFR